MVFSQFEDIRIASIAACVPSNTVDIAALANDPEEDPKFIKSFMRNTGIRAKRKCVGVQTASDYAYAAAKQIMDAGYYKPEEIGVLVNLTQTPDYRTPSSAMTIQKRLGLSKNCLAFDVNLGCSGFVYGVSLAASLLQTSDAAKAIVTVGDTLARGRMNRGLKRSFNTTLLFGDGSAAMLLEKKEGTGFASALMSDGTGHKALSRPYNAWRHPVGPFSIPGDDIAVFNFTISEVPAILTDFTNKTGAAFDTYDDLVLHQANMMILKNIAKRVGVPMEKVPVSLDRFGNTSGASVPLTIVDKYGAVDEDRELSLLTCAFGIGLSWGVVGFQINARDILPMGEDAEAYDDGYPDDLTPEWEE